MACWGEAYEPVAAEKCPGECYDAAYKDCLLTGTPRQCFDKYPQCLVEQCAVDNCPYAECKELRDCAHKRTDGTWDRS